MVESARAWGDSGSRDVDGGVVGSGALYINRLVASPSSLVSVGVTAAVCYRVFPVLPFSSVV